MLTKFSPAHVPRHEKQDTSSASPFTEKDK